MAEDADQYIAAHSRENAPVRIEDPHDVAILATHHSPLQHGSSGHGVHSPRSSSVPMHLAPGSHWRDAKNSHESTTGSDSSSGTRENTVGFAAGHGHWTLEEDEISDFPGEVKPRSLSEPANLDGGSPFRLEDHDCEQGAHRSGSLNRMEYRRLPEQYEEQNESKPMLSFSATKNLAAGGMNVALLTGNSSQLRQMLEMPYHRFKCESLTLLCLSIVLQLVGTALFLAACWWDSRKNANPEIHTRESYCCLSWLFGFMNLMAVLCVFVVSADNIILSVFLPQSDGFSAAPTGDTVTTIIGDTVRGIQANVMTLTESHPRKQTVQRANIQVRSKVFCCFCMKWFYRKCRSRRNPFLLTISPQRST